MNHAFLKQSRILVIVLAATAAWLSVGCARKATQAPPAQSQPPAQATTPPKTTEPGDSTPTPSTTTSDVQTSDFQPVFFDYDSATLRDDARSALDHNARVLREHADARITIEGHCDERGTVEYNQALGERRAQAAMEYLVAAGISASQLGVISYGKDRPFDSSHDERAWALNRRAHCTVR